MAVERKDGFCAETDEICGFCTIGNRESGIPHCRRRCAVSYTHLDVYKRQRQKKLIGTVSAKSLLLALPEDLVRTITEPVAAQIETHADREEAARLLQRYGLEALPVVDKENCLVGIVTFDDALEVLNSETEEDIAKMAAIQPAKESYFKTSVWMHAAHRTGWLLVLMLSATFTGLIISHYEAAFLSLIHI